MKKRLLSLFLCAVMIFGFVPGLAAAAKDTGLNIYCDGEQVSNIGLPEKTPLQLKHCSAKAPQAASSGRSG